MVALGKDACLEAMANKCWRDLLIQTVDPEVTDLLEGFSLGDLIAWTGNQMLPW